MLLIEVLLEAWLQELLAGRTVDAAGEVVGELPGWPKQLKNGLLVSLVALSVVKLSVDRLWPASARPRPRFTTRADLALAVLLAVMIMAGLLGTSGATLTGEAIFVYLRGAIVFYAVRVLDPTWPQIRRVLVIVGSVVGAVTAVSIVQMFAGRPAYSGVGWVDLTWAGIHRAHGLLDHPNHLGHVLGLALIGLLAWMSGPAWAGRGRPAWPWWLAVAGAALGLAASQSRESMLATLAAFAVIFFLRRSAVLGVCAARGSSLAAARLRRSAVLGGRTLLIASAVIVTLFAGHLVARPGNLEELTRRLRGVFSAVDTPSGEERCAGFATIADCVAAGRVEAREIRLLFFQQGARLLADRPLLGYGVGQFGGVVAEQHDPAWERDPRFPGGFDLYDFDGTTVDSFWLHLTVETGVLGLLAYLAWLWLIAVPLLSVTRRYAGRRIWGAGGARDPTGDVPEAVALWGIGVLLFTLIVGVFSPALEDPLFPPLVFAVLGFGWVLTAGSGTPRRSAPASR